MHKWRETKGDEVIKLLEDGSNNIFFYIRDIEILLLLLLE